MNKKSLIRNVILVFAILVVVIIVVCSIGDIKEIYKVLTTQCNYLYILVCLGLLIGYCLCFQLSLTIMMKHRMKSLNVVDSMLISGSEFFFNGITPFSTGGQPYQVYGFRKKGVRLSTGTSVLLVNFLVYQISLNILLIVGISVYFPKLQQEVPDLLWLIIVGFLLNFLTMIVILGLGLTKTANKFLNVMFKFLCKFKLMRRILAKKIPHIHQSIANMQGAFKEISKNIPLMLLCSAIKFIGFALYYSIPFFVFYALGVNLQFREIFYIIAMASFALAITAWVPTPGASGGAELAFTALFGALPEIAAASAGNSTLAVSGMVLWRFVTYYFVMIYGFIMYTTFEGRLKNYESKFLF